MTMYAGLLAAYGGYIWWGTTALLWSSAFFGWVPDVGGGIKWLTKMVVWHWLSNVLPLVPPFLAFLYFAGIDWLGGSKTWLVAMELVSVAMWWRTMVVSPGAIRWLDNDWRSVSQGELLYPSILYVLRVKQYNDAAVAEFIEERAEDAGDDDLPEEAVLAETSAFLVSM